MSEEEIIKDIKETNYNEENVEELLYELENDTGTYSCYDNAMAIIYYKNLYKQTKKELNNLKEIEQAHKTDNGLLRQELDMQIEHNKELEEYITDKIEIEDEIQTYISEKFVKDQYINKDKIKEKIKELEKEQKEYEESQEWEIQDDLVAKIMVLEELLEEK